MASPARVSQVKDFEAELVRIKYEIEKRFSLLIDFMKERERELIQQLEEIGTTHRMEQDNFLKSISELEAVLKLTRENIQSENLQEFQDSVIKKMRQKKRELDSQIRCKQVCLVWDDSALDVIRKLCVLNATAASPLVQYNGKINPVICIGTQGSKERQFHHPCRVAINAKNGMVYIADQMNNRVQVFESEGHFLYKFGDIDGAGKMNKPLFIAIVNDRVLVSNVGCLLIYDLSGNFIRQIGSKGTAHLHFNRPNGIAVNEVDKEIYVCDYGNNRVQILSKFYTFLSEFAVQAPRDIKLTAQHIHVLTAYHPFFITFCYKFTQVLHNMSASIGNRLKDPRGLCIDGSGKLLISDFYQNQVLIFDNEGNPLYTLEDASIRSPIGVSIDKNGRIVIVSYKACLLIF